MSKLDKLLRELCPDGVEHKKLVDAVSIERGKRVVRSQLSISGKYPVYQNSLTPLGYHTDYNYNANTTFIIVAGAAGEIGFSDKAFWAADDCFTVVCPENVLNRYIYHLLLNNQNQLASKVRKASIPRLSKSAIENLVIPIPPLDVQREIVRILDNFTNLTAELAAELTARKMQYSYYRDNLLSFNMPVSKKKIGEITRVFSAARVHKNEWTQEGVPFYRSSDVISKFNGVENSRGKAYISFDLYKRLSAKSGKIMKDDILITGGGTIGIPYVVPSDEPIYVKDADLLCIQKSKEFNSRFLYHYFLSTEFRKYLENITHNATIAHYTISQIENTPVPLPPLDVQNRIVNVLDNFEKICSDLNIGLPAEIEARQKQYEYYRDKLLTFKEVAAT